MSAQLYDIDLLHVGFKSSFSCKFMFEKIHLRKVVNLQALFILLSGISGSRCSLNMKLKLMKVIEKGRQLMVLLS